MTDVSMRRTPQQARSQQRVDLILDVAADIFAEVGYESATTNAIAERAGVSIGSLYRYFPDKDAILHALSNRYYEQVRALFDEVFTKDVVYLPLPVLLDRLIDPARNHFLGQQSFSELDPIIVLHGQDHIIKIESPALWPFCTFDFGGNFFSLSIGGKFQGCRHDV